MFLFQMFPLGDKSSVNLRGEFHVENFTNFDEHLQTIDPDVMQDIESEATQDVEKPSEEQSKPAKDSIEQLYVTFWSLQRTFFKSAAHFRSSCSGRGQTRPRTHAQKAFGQCKKYHSPRAEDHRGLKRKRSQQGNEFASSFNPKYLTSRDLFELELSDLTFQRHILVQALVLIDFLPFANSQGKEKGVGVEAAESNGLCLYTE